MPARRTIENHLASLRACDLCPRMHKPVVVGRPVTSRVLLVGQAPGDKEPVLGRPFAWTAGKTLFKWFNGALGWSEDEVRDRIYFAAVCRCFPGKRLEGGDRVPAPRRDRQLLHLARTGVRPPASRPRAACRQVGDGAISPGTAGSADRDCGSFVSHPVSRPHGRLYSAAASLGRFALAPDGTGKNPAAGRAGPGGAARGGQTGIVVSGRRRCARCSSLRQVKSF